MALHEFSLLLNAAEITDGQADALFEAGLDDGTISTSECMTRIGITREAESLESAIRSAIGQVNAAGLSVVRVVIEADQLTPPTKT
jgi:hypothetical protein